MLDLNGILEDILLAAALSADAFAVAVSYGVNKTLMNKFSVFIICVISTAGFAFSMTAAGYAARILPDEIIKYIPFWILFILGILKLFQNTANSAFKFLTFKESVLLGLSNSADGFAAGFGTGIKTQSIMLLIILIFSSSFLSVTLGNRLGFSLSNKLKINITKLGAVILIILAFKNL